MDDRSLSLHPFNPTTASVNSQTTMSAPLNPLSLAQTQQQHPFLTGATPSSMHNPTCHPHHARSDPVSSSAHTHDPQTTHPNSHPHHNNHTTTTTAPTQEDPSTGDQETYPHQIAGGAGPTATAPFLRDFSLVAEAAKRAQMSIVMRDLESVTL